MGVKLSILIKRFEDFLNKKSKGEAFLTLLSFISLRFFFETLLESAHAVEIKFDFILHHYLFFVTLFILLYNYLRFLLGKDLSFKLLCYGFSLILLPPFIDYLITRGKGYVLAYVGDLRDIPLIYISLFTSPLSYTKGSSPGMKFEVIFASILLSVFLFYKLKGKKRIIFSIFNIIIFPFFPLFVGSIFAIPELYLYSLSTPIYVYKSALANMIFVIILTVLTFLSFRKLFPEKISIFSFIPSFLTLTIILYFSIKISEFIPRYLFLPGNILFILLHSFSVFLLYISFEKEKVFVIPLILSFLYISIQSAASIVTFFVFLISFYVFRSYRFINNFLFIIYALIQGMCFFALGSKIPFPDFYDHIRRYSASYYKKKGNYSKAISLLSKIKNKEFYNYYELAENSLFNGDTFDFDIFLEMAKIKYISVPPHFNSMEHKVDFWKLEKERFLMEKNYNMLYVVTLSVLNSRVESEKILLFLKSISDYLNKDERVKLKKFLSLYGY